MGLGILLFSTFVFLVFALYFATKLFGSQENQTDQIHDTTSGVFYYIGPFHHQNNHPNCIYVPNYPITHPPAYCTPLKGDQGGHSIKLEPSKSINSELPHISTVEVKVKEKACYPQRLEETSHVNKETSQGNTWSESIKNQTISQGSGSISSASSEETKVTKTDCSGLRTLAKAHVKDASANDNKTLSQRFENCENQKPDEQLPSYKQLSIDPHSTPHTRLSLKQDTAYLGRQQPDYRPPSTVRNVVYIQGIGRPKPNKSSHSPP